MQPHLHLDAYYDVATPALAVTLLQDRHRGCEWTWARIFCFCTDDTTGTWPPRTGCYAQLGRAHFAFGGRGLLGPL